MNEEKKSVDNPHLVPKDPLVQTPPPTGKVLSPTGKAVVGATAVVPVQNSIPDGSMDMKDVLPGYSPNQGSPKENDPSQLANPNNPLSPVTVPVNPSNPANMPQTQSEKPASEVRIGQALAQVPSGSPQSVETPDAKAIREKKVALLKEIGDFLKQYPQGESHIPHNSPYWAKVNEYRALNNP